MDCLLVWIRLCVFACGGLLTFMGTGANFGLAFLVFWFGFQGTPSVCAPVSDLVFVILASVAGCVVWVYLLTCYLILWKLAHCVNVVGTVVCYL